MQICHQIKRRQPVNPVDKEDLLYRLFKITELSFIEVKSMFSVPRIVANICLHSWGRSKESTALQRLKKLLQKQHKDVDMKKVGLIISPDHPFLAASPDAFFTCSCHGKFIVEVKCPYSSHGGNIRNAAEKDRNFFLSYCPDTKSYHLKCYHAYYYQVQMQLVTGCQQGFFAVWESNDIVVVSVKPDAALFQKFWRRVPYFSKESCYLN